MIVILLIFIAAIAACVAVDARRAPEQRELSGSRLAADAVLPDPRDELAEQARARGEFDVVLRGYRMDQVDERIRSLTAEIEALTAETRVSRRDADAVAPRVERR